MKACHIGVNGGGGKTDMILLDADGRQKACIRCDGTNPSLIGSTAATKILFAGLKQLLEEAGARQNSVKTLLLCMAGHPPYWGELSRQLHGWGKVEAARDSEPILHLAVKEGAGIVLHGATGSFVAARDLEENTHYAGGLGWVFGDAGSGFDIGRRGISQALLQLQGWRESGSLSKALREFTCKESYEAISQGLYSHPQLNNLIAQFAPIVFRLAEDGDGEAREIIGLSIDDLAETAFDMARKLQFPADSSFPCGSSGRFLLHPIAETALRKSFDRRNLEWKIAPVRESPLAGVRRMLANLADIPFVSIKEA